MRARILVVEGEAIVAADIKSRLMSFGYDVVGITLSGEDALEKVEETRPDLVLMAIHLKGDLDGIEAAAQIRSRFNVPVVYLVTYLDEKMLKRTEMTEPLGFICKPIDGEELKSIIEKAVSGINGPREK